MAATLPSGGTFTVLAWKSLEPEIRRRRKHHKSFTGCIRCKKSRVRCSEGKPACDRCRRLKWNCEYNPPKPWIFTTGEDVETAQPRQFLRMPLVDSSLTLSGRRALSYYEERAAPIFSAYFGKYFFNSLVLQLSHNEAIVRDALIGASALIESAEAEDVYVRSRLWAEFLCKYNSNIKAITSATNKPSIEAVLTACALFACYELVRGSVAVAFAHVKAGLDIIKSRLKELANNGNLHTPEATFLRSQAQPIMAGFAIQAYLYGTSLLPPEQILEMAPERYELPHVPHTFGSINQAHHCLSGIIHNVIIAGTPFGFPHNDDNLRVMDGLFGEWECSFQEYERKLTNAQLIDQKAEATVLRCNLKMAYVAMQGPTLSTNQRSPGTKDLSTKFAPILQLYKTINQGQASFECGVKNTVIELIPAPFIIAVTTTNQEQQAEALAILEALDRKEANWSSQEAADVAWHIIYARAVEQTSADEEKVLKQMSTPTTTCLHVASIQWSLGRCIPKIRNDLAIRSVVDNCICQQKFDSEPPTHQPS